MLKSDLSISWEESRGSIPLGTELCRIQGEGGTRERGVTGRGWTDGPSVGPSASGTYCPPEVMAALLSDHSAALALLSQTKSQTLTEVKNWDPRKMRLWIPGHRDWPGSTFVRLVSVMVLAPQHRDTAGLSRKSWTSGLCLE